MKNLLFYSISLLFIFSVYGCSAIIGTTTDSQLETVERVVEVGDATKNELYVRANNWMVSAFNDAESVVQFTDKESGNITGKYFLSKVTSTTQYGPGKNAYAIINIQVKDGGSKITITPEKFQYMKGNMYTLYNEDVAQNQIESLLASFESNIKKEDDSDW